MALTLLAILFIGLGWFAYESEQSISEGRIHVHKHVEFPKDTPELKRHVLVFFGYVGCNEVCNLRMAEIAKIYNAFFDRKQGGELSVLFINLHPSVSTAQADAYAKAFHPSFHGISYEKQTLLNMLRMFNVYYSHSLTDRNEIEHTQFLYFVHKDTTQHFYLYNIYTHAPYDTKMVVDDLIKDIE